MKTTSVVASVLLSTFALAAPLDKRAYATKTEVHVEYYTVYTTVTGTPPAAAAATSDPALFYEKPTTLAQETTTNAPPSPPPQAPTQAPPAPPKETTTEKPAEPTTSAYTPPPPPPSSPAPPPAPKPTTQAPPPPPAESTQPAAPAPAPSQPSGGDGEVHKGGSFTMNRYQGGLGACGEPVSDDGMFVALAVDVFGTATVDPMTGKTTNKWCNKKIEVTNDGKTAIATIVDRCEGCTNGGLDATPALWDALTGGLGNGNGDRIYSMSWKLI